jgi:uncharacterized protein
VTFISERVARMVGVSPALTTNITVQRNLRIPMPDGTIQLADRYYPADGSNPPLVLTRSPYGRRFVWGMLFGRIVAERGFQAVVASCRGTKGSGGTFDPFANEREDGLATVAWLREQPWWPGTFGTIGPSYLGFTQWAIAAHAGEDLRAIATDVTVSALHHMMYAGGSLSWFTMLEWMQANEMRQTRLGFVRKVGAGRRLARGARTLPVRQADRAVTGHTVEYFQRWLDNSGPDPEYWEGRRFDRDVQDVTVPVSMVGGWYDFMLPFQLADYAALRAAGRQPELTIGPWTHAEPAGLGAGVEHGIRWLRQHLRDEHDQARDQPVRVFVTGAEEWRDLADWPPPAGEGRWHLHSGARLATDGPAEGSEPDSHRYDPADPTPALGGPIGLTEKVRLDNRPLEARADVLVYTSEPLASDLDVVGVPVVELYLSADNEHLDVFARLCDVGPDGVSLNVCDALLRVTAERPVRIELWPTAHRFLTGHRLRLQVSGGAFPRYPRHRGTADPYSLSVELVPSTRRIFHDPDRPSALVLPVIP